MKKFIVLFLPFFLSSCAGSYNFAWFSINPFHPQGLSNIEFLIGGLWTTIWVSFISLILAAIVGLIIFTNSSKVVLVVEEVVVVDSSISSNSSSISTSSS